MLCLIIVLHPLAHILSLVPKPGSCQISRNRLICVLAFATRVKSLILWLRGTKCPKSYIRGTKMISGLNDDHFSVS